jgi:hypothetical protein
MPADIPHLYDAHKLASNHKSTWTDEEDQTLSQIVANHGSRNWPFIATFLPGRSGKQCRERYKNHLDPIIKKGPFCPEEDRLIIRMVEEHGPKWAFLATLMQGRTDNAIKNRYNSSLRRTHEEGRFRDVVVNTPPSSPVLSAKRLKIDSSVHKSLLDFELFALGDSKIHATNLKSHGVTAPDSCPPLLCNATVATDLASDDLVAAKILCQLKAPL